MSGLPRYPPQARAAVLGMLNAIQLRYRDTSEVRVEMPLLAGELVISAHHWQTPLPPFPSLTSWESPSSR